MPQTLVLFSPLLAMIYLAAAYAMGCVFSRMYPEAPAAEIGGCALLWPAVLALCLLVGALFLVLGALTGVCHVFGSLVRFGLKATSR